jgi:hypothetical protein
LRKLATSSDDQAVWATAHDSEQASYVNGKLQVFLDLPAGHSPTLPAPPGLDDP